MNATADSDLEQRFQRLANQWREETEELSSTIDLFMHPAYQEIIGMGPAVLPLLLRDLEATGSNWFWALRAIAGENPTPAADRGKTRRMTECWLAWGRARGLV